MKTKTSKKNSQGGGGYVNFPCHIDSGHSIIMPLYLFNPDSLTYSYIQDIAIVEQGLSCTTSLINRVLDNTKKWQRGCYLLQISDVKIPGSHEITQCFPYSPEEPYYDSKNHSYMCAEAIQRYMREALRFGHQDIMEFLKPVMYRRIIRFEGYPK